MNQSQFRDALSRMPPLRHSFADEPFDPAKSEVLKWVSSLPGFHNWLYARAVSTGRIQFDQATGTWRGVARGPVGRPRTEHEDVPPPPE